MPWRCLVLESMRVQYMAMYSPDPCLKGPLASALEHAKGRFSMNCSFSQRQQHHHPLKHHVVVSGLLLRAIFLALLDLGLLIAAV
jgi:hypothetical protein